MNREIIFPKNYSSLLSHKETQSAIKMIKDVFPAKLSKALNLSRITAPIMVTEASGINDDLNGVERKVSFSMKEIEGTAQVVQSLAKWKRMALGSFGYETGEGIYTDMNAIRRDDSCDNIHSLFVDQWDWEKVISRENRTKDYLKATVKNIVGAIYETNEILKEHFPALSCNIDKDVFFITTQELEDIYPNLTAKERENEITKKHGTVFLMEIGGALKSGKPHDGRAPDYDDWSLNGDIIIRNDVLDIAFEVSSMGIRVDEKTLRAQLKIASVPEREKFPFHSGILNGTLPLTVGGGIGQSRLCMLLLQKAHIGEVQVSIWPDDMRKECAEHNINLL